MFLRSRDIFLPSAKKKRRERTVIDIVTVWHGSIVIPVSIAIKSSDTVSIEIWRDTVPASLLKLCDQDASSFLYQESMLDPIQLIRDSLIEISVGANLSSTRHRIRCFSLR